MSDRLKHQLFRRLLREHTECFLAKCFNTLLPGVGFLPNWHIRAILYHLELVRLGKIRRLIINVPPRSLKSLISSVAFPAFVLGHNPKEKIVCVSYADKLSVSLANDFRAIVTAPWYNEVFPEARTAKQSNNAALVTFSKRGFRRALTVKGAMTGMGGSLFLIDDPLKGIDALSASARDSVNQWFVNTLLSRLDDQLTGRIVIIMQRLHLDDLVGTVTAKDDSWTILNLPAIAEHETRIPIGPNEYYFRQAGEVLHPAREPMEILERHKRQMGSSIFSAQYQQSPIPDGGAMIKRGWIVRAKCPPPLDAPYSQIIQSWDTASKAGPDHDWSVCTTWLRTQDGQNHLLHVLRERCDYPTLKAKAIAHADAWKAHVILIEDAGTGTALIAEMKRTGRSVIPIKPIHDKIARMSIHSAKFEAGQVIFPLEATWLPDLEAELFASPTPAMMIRWIPSARPSHGGSASSGQAGCSRRTSRQYCLGKLLEQN